jgi:radical SAM superfamily enzyme YgiQ (UPF0313 family)
MRQTIGEKGRIFYGSFPSEVRPEHVTEETVALVKEYADNDNLVIGVQSGSQRMLDLCGRGHTVDDIFKAVTVIGNHGLKAYVDFIFGLPGETAADIDETLNVIKELVKQCASIHAHAFMPLPQTRFAQAQPQGIDRRTAAVLNNLISSGVAFGAWRQQERQALKIARYWQTGEL